MKTLSPTPIEETIKTFEDAVEAARLAALNEDNSRWAIGDISNVINREYGQATFERFADEIGRSSKTVYEYWRMSQFWQISARAEISTLYPNLTYSHYRRAREASSNLEEAKQIISKAGKRGWTVRRMDRVLDRWARRNQKPRATKAGEWLCDVIDKNGRLFKVAIYGPDLDKFVPGTRYRISAYYDS